MGGVFNTVNANLYHYAGNNPVKYTDPDGRTLLGNLCYVAAGLTLAAGTTVSVVSSGTLAVVVEPVAIKTAVALAAAGVAINTSELVKENVNGSSISLAKTKKRNKSNTEANPTDQQSPLPEKGVDSGKQSLPDMKENPPDHPDYKPPKNWDGKKVKNPNGKGSGWPAKNGDVWVPENHNGTHAPHWDVQHKKGGHTRVYPED